MRWYVVGTSGLLAAFLCGCGGDGGEYQQAPDAPLTVGAGTEPASAVQSPVAAPAAPTAPAGTTGSTAPVPGQTAPAQGTAPVASETPPAGAAPLDMAPPAAQPAPPVVPPGDMMSNAGAGGFPPPAEPAPPMSMPPVESTPAPAGNMDPVIPEITGDCPAWRNGTISYMGLGGIEIAAGPRAAGPTAPMVFYWHGTGSFAGEYALMATAVHQGVIAEGGILVSFNNTTGGDLCSGTLIFGPSDFKLTDQLVACAVKEHNIDPRRIFATGCSAGGLFSGCMATNRSNYLAAAASNSGGLVLPLPFQNGYTPALMTIHGAPGVDVVVVDFSDTSATADKIFKDRGGFVINCNHGGGHCGGGGLAPDIWNFFKAHPYGTTPSPWQGGLPAGFNRACMIY